MEFLKIAIKVDAWERRHKREMQPRELLQLFKQVKSTDQAQAILAMVHS